MIAAVFDHGKVCPAAAGNVYDGGSQFCQFLNGLAGHPKADLFDNYGDWKVSDDLAKVVPPQKSPVAFGHDGFLGGIQVNFQGIGLD